MTKVRDEFRLDVSRFMGVHQAPAGIALGLKVIAEPGLQFIALARLQMGLERRGSTRLARVVHLLNLRLTGAEFGHGCKIGPGLVAKHPLGLVIGGGSTIGRNCTILHNVTLGERRPDDSPVPGLAKYPTIKDDCLIGNGAILLGPITVGDGARVGAAAVVLHDVKAGTTVVGVPARELGSASGT